MSAQVSLLISDLSWAQPELYVAIFALAGVVLGAVFKDGIAPFLGIVGACVFVAAGIWAFKFQPGDAVALFNGSMVVDSFAGFVKGIIAFCAAATLLLGFDHFSKTKEQRFEFPIMTALAVLGLFVMASANDLITLYVGVELQSLASYVLAAWRRDDAKSSEAGLKYFVLGAISSGLLLFGASYIYGFTGSLRFTEIAAATDGGGFGLLFGLVLLICGLAFKIGAAPFHMWTPDVYEGAPTPVTALFSAAPKMAALALLARVLYEPFAGMADQWKQVIVALSALSMAVGSVAALLQTNMKRLMAYSSIANMGFALMPLASGTPDGAAAALVYMAIYLPTTIGVFALILAMRRDGAFVESIDDLAGLASRRVLMASLMTALLFSLAGIPPLAGFWGKWVAFKAAAEGGLVWLAVLGGVAAVVAAAYYLRVIASMWFKPAGAALQAPSGTTLTTALIGAALSFPILVLALGWLETWARAAVAASF
ncbi:MAG: NADH-quinone oxidoreductase subunit NuoN [Hyphomonadaceae bacterium]|nr:NADH-quinone oxidoreductase subunit NuoN [Hyphomonadaceae bacterium]